jgi:plasmid stabilization system protein ParE
MRIRWTEPAASDLTRICDYIRDHDAPGTARRVALTTYVSVKSLARFRFLNVRGFAGKAIYFRLSLCQN